jgi:hypothetical protein
MSEKRVARIITRRQALGRLVYGGAGLALAGGFLPQALSAASRTRSKARARSVIQIWMWGGPCHLDTFDPKPEAGADYCGPLNKTIATNVSGIRYNGALPMLARQADKLAVIRSMTHGVNGHETASYITQTGHTPGGKRIVYPSVGAVVNGFLGKGKTDEWEVPPYVVLTRPLGRFSEVGFLGLRFKPFVTGGDPNQKRFAVEGIVQQGVTDERQRQRRELLHDLDTLGKAMPKDPRFERLDECEDEAYEMILGDAGKVFDLDKETPEVRERYGRSKFGQSCLVARRLVEKGVPYISINYEGWDTHKRHFESMSRKLPEMDRGMSALIEDLSERGLLDSTIVWWGGEFGRTPRIQFEAPWNGGRNHFGACFTHVVAGGGFQGGTVVGASDARGETPAERPVHPRELIGSMYHLLGIDPNGPMAHARGFDVKALPPAKEGTNDGLLKEILP